MGDNPSQYVKLKKENITDQPETEPGELSQPVEVPVLNGPRCPDCGQVLPLEFAPPQNEPWSTGIFDCAVEPTSCQQGALCPCVLFGHNVAAIKPGIPWTTACTCHAVLVEGGIAAGTLLACMPHLVDPGTCFFFGELLVYLWWICGLYAGLFRQELQHKYHLKSAPCDPCLVHCVLHPCALCQEHREMQLRLAPAGPAAPLNPPPAQEMSATSVLKGEIPHNEPAAPAL